MTDADVSVFLSQCITRVAFHCGIPDTDWLSPSEIADKIELTNPELGKKLGAFEDAYVDWWQYSKEILAIRKTRALTNEELNTMIQKAAERDQTRNELRRSLAE